MGFRIGRISSSLAYGPGAIARKTDDQPAHDRNDQQQNEQDARKQRHQEHTFEELKQAVALTVIKMMAANDNNTGEIGLEAVQSGGTDFVRVLSKEGNVIREMSGQEFLQLQDSSGDDTLARGKVLDQKC